MLLKTKIWACELLTFLCIKSFAFPHLQSAQFPFFLPNFLFIFVILFAFQEPCFSLPPKEGIITFPIQRFPQDS